MSRLSSSTTYICDLCGEEMPRPPVAVLIFEPGSPQTEWDYHTDCFEHVRHAVYAALHTSVTSAPLNRQDARAAWKATAHHERERIIVETLGDAHLTIAELRDAIEHARPDLGPALSDGMVRVIAETLRSRGDLTREPEHHRTGTLRGYRYSRAPLHGPILDLDNQFGGH